VRCNTSKSPFPPYLFIDPPLSSSLPPSLVPSFPRSPLPSTPSNSGALPPSLPPSLPPLAPTDNGTGEEGKRLRRCLAQEEEDLSGKALHLSAEGRREGGREGGRA